MNSLAKLSLTARIYLIIILVLVASSLATGVISVLKFTSQHEKYHSDRLKRKESAILLSVKYFLNQSSVSTIPEDLEIVLGDKFRELSDINKMNINVYNTAGELMLSAHTDSLASLRPDPRLPELTLRLLQDSGKVVYRVEQEDRNYLSSYSLVRDNREAPLIIINTPYPERDDILEAEITEYLVTLGEIYLLIFIAGSVLAYFLSNYITSSLRTIGDKMSTTDISHQNKPLEWDSDDEIGRLVVQYNRMVGELEQSALQLAKSERESAWREMAKQVAHEIKNPLTPMKLSVQHLQRSLKPDSPDFDARLRQYSEMMVEQIDTLSRIAGEFSDFAKMPMAVRTEVNLFEVIQTVSELYQHQDSYDLICKIEPNSTCLVLADKEQLVRVLNNLIKNAIQAIPEGRKGRISIELTKSDQTVMLSVSDNGIGIRDDLRDRIFYPNFTTKTSGAGLGLSMVKSIIESIGGSVSFDSTPDIGTVFTVRIPVL